MKTIRGRVAERAYAGRFAPITGTATGGAVNSLIDSAYAIPGATTDHYDYKIIKIATDAGGGAAAPEGEVRYISEGGYTAASGTFTPSVNFTAAVASGDTYEVHEIHPTEIDNIIKRKVRNLYMPTFFPLSLHIVAGDDNDMESAPATNYSQSNGTRANESTIVYNGAQSLKLTATATGGYAYTGSIGVPGASPLYAAVMCYVTSGDSATFRVIDVTNSNATIEDATSDEPSWMEPVYPFTVPSTCEQIDFRFISDADTDIAYWDDFHVWRQGRGVYPCPSWITRPEQIEDVIAFPQGQGGPSSSLDYAANQRESHRLSWGIERVNRRATNELHIWVDAGHARPFIVARRNLAEPTSDTSAIFFEPDLLVEGVLSEVYELLAKMSTGNEAVRYTRNAQTSENKWMAGLRNLGLLDPIEREGPSRIYVR